MGRITSLLSPFKRPSSLSSLSSLSWPSYIYPPRKYKCKLEISLPSLDPKYLPCYLRDSSNVPPCTIHGYTVPGRFLADCSAIFLDSLTIGDFKRLGQLVITATGVGRLFHLSLIPESDRLIVVAVTRIADVNMNWEGSELRLPMENELRLRLIYFLMNRYGGYFRCLNQLYPGELESLSFAGYSSHRCHPLAVV
ncbi:hypothetical protein AA313_de0206570 [Arthrobotrys entomopaga]|nr:hypothetical protein AA313_de0206570 [Arthrobotrys entomopaga]